MPRVVAPAHIAPPASNYAPAILHTVPARRLIISGQIGVAPDGAIVPGLRAQMEQAWANLLAIVAEAGMTHEHVVKIVCYATDPSPETTRLYRETRDAALQGHAAASTYVVVSALAHPDLLFEVEAEAIAE